jgi:hypothetical protein
MSEPGDQGRGRGRARGARGTRGGVRRKVRGSPSEGDSLVSNELKDSKPGYSIDLAVSRVVRFMKNPKNFDKANVGNLNGDDKVLLDREKAFLTQVVDRVG